MGRWGFSDALAFVVAMTVRDMSREKEKRLIKTQQFYQECYEKIASDSEWALNIVSKVVTKGVTPIYSERDSFGQYLPCVICVCSCH